jgi:hypothetical protein
MTKTITANIPATRKIVKGKVWTTEAYTATFDCNEAGQWTYREHGERLLADEVIDVCRKATNWTAIRQTHFPMFGFHN